MKVSKIVVTLAVLSAAVLAWGSTGCFADPEFASTSDPSGHWYVSTAVNRNGDGQLSSFTTSNFIQAVPISGRTGWIADNTSGTHGGIGNWTFFVYRQTFDLTGYDPATANLQFQWAADDSGEGYADRGSWIPKFSLNGGSFISYPGSPTPTYGYSPLVSLTSGFVSGLNQIDFYVEGNGQTDGFALATQGFTARVAPEPASMILFGLGSAVMVWRRKRSA